MPGLQDTSRGILQTQINRCTSNVTPSPCFRRDDDGWCSRRGLHDISETLIGVSRMYYVYILASRRHGTLYIGVTNSLRKRLEQHRNGEGSEFVKAYRVYRLVYVESYDRADEAIAREKQLKRWK